MALLTPSASPGTMGYQLDVALAAAGERELCALAVYGAPATSLTAIRLADRVRVALLTIDPAVDLTDLAFGLARLIRTDPGEVLARALEGQRAVAAAEPEGTEAVLAAAAAGRGRRVRAARAPAGVAVPVTSDGRPDGYVCTRRRTTRRPCSPRTCWPGRSGGSARWRSSRRAGPRRRRRTRSPRCSPRPPTAVGRAAERARDVGVRLHEDLAVIRLELVSEPDRDLLTRRAMDEELDDLVLAVTGEGWYRTRVDGALLLVPRRRAATRCPPSACSTAIRDDVPGRDRVLRRRRAPPRPRGAARERRRRPPRPPSAARGWGRPWAPVHIDAVGLPPLLVDWLGSRAAQLSTQRLLAPFDALDDARAEAAVRTLSTYLDEHGSLTRSAERLHLHKNAVAYRMRRIREQLAGVDLDDPDRRLELQLACRAWLLTR